MPGSTFFYLWNKKCSSGLSKGTLNFNLSLFQVVSSAQIPTSLWVCKFLVLEAVHDEIPQSILTSNSSIWAPVLQSFVLIFTSDILVS
jgi:hypothetical protein